MATVRETLETAIKHHEAGDLRRAGEIYRRILEADSEHPDALHLSGLIAHQVGEHELAVERIGRAIGLNPKAAVFHSNMGAVYTALGKLAEAVGSYRQALEIQPNLVSARSNLGNALKQQGELEEAEICFRWALQIDPDCVEALNNLGTLLLDQNNTDEAQTYLRRALAIDPDHIEALNGLGSALQGQGILDEAEACFRRVLQADPDHAKALSNLAALLERLNRIDEANNTAERCLATTPDDSLAALVSAKCQKRAGRHREAIERLEKAARSETVSPLVAEGICFELGRLYDRTGDTRRALERFTEGNRRALKRTRGSAVEENRQQYLRNIEILGDVFTREWVESWSPAPPLDDGHTPVFLVGFPRSGTTLLDVTLDSHPRIQTLDERPAILQMKQEMGELTNRRLTAMADLTEEDIEQLRAVYFRAVDGYLDRRPGCLLVDKQPMGIIHVGMILRIFPAARFIVAVRHPYDVCLSCFMQDFDLNGAMANFVTLESAAQLYDRSMRLWQQYVQTLPHERCTVKYENLIEDFEGNARRLLEFVGVEWDDAVLAYADHARRRGNIHTASYQQVTEPIYKRACNRWQRYDEQLRPIMDLIEPYVEQFGYRDGTAGPGDAT